MTKNPHYQNEISKYCIHLNSRPACSPQSTPWCIWHDAVKERGASSLRQNLFHLCCRKILRGVGGGGGGRESRERRVKMSQLGAGLALRPQPLPQLRGRHSRSVQGVVRLHAGSHVPATETLHHCFLVTVAHRLGKAALTCTVSHSVISQKRRR